MPHRGHVITKDGLNPNPVKIDSISNFPEPKNQKEIKSLPGFSGSQRRFISNFVDISQLLKKLLQNGSTCCLRIRMYIASRRREKAAILTPILLYLNFCKPLRRNCATDASGFAVALYYLNSLQTRIYN